MFFILLLHSAKIKINPHAIYHWKGKWISCKKNTSKKVVGQQHRWNETVEEGWKSKSQKINFAFTCLVKKKTFFVTPSEKNAFYLRRTPWKGPISCITRVQLFIVTIIVNKNVGLLPGRPTKQFSRRTTQSRCIGELSKRDSFLRRCIGEKYGKS